MEFYSSPSENTRKKRQRSKYLNLQKKNAKTTRHPHTHKHISHLKTFISNYAKPHLIHTSTQTTHLYAQTHNLSIT